MRTANSQRLTIALAVLCVALLVLSGSLFWNYGWLKVEVAFASEQTAIFKEMRTQALQGDAKEAVSRLKYVVWYYPSGTKQKAGSRLDRMVESARDGAIRDIIAHLRTVTGEDLGDDPEVWIRKFTDQRAD